MTQVGMSSNYNRGIAAGRGRLLDFINEPLNPVLPSALATRAGETSRIMDGGQCDLWYGGGPLFEDLYYTFAVDPSCKTFAAPVVCLNDIRFPYVIKVAGTYYLFAQRPSSGTADIFMWSCADKVSWLIMHGGASVFAQGGPGTIYNCVWNPGVVVIGGIWHFFVECGINLDQSDVGIGYATSTLAAHDWNANRTAFQIIPGGGNPNPIYVPNRNSILLICGRIRFTDPVYWDIGALNALLTDNLFLAASWKTAPYLKVHFAGMHTADPDFVIAGPGKIHNIILGFLYNQAESWQRYLDFTLDQFFDLVTV